ncbi:MAG TPA: acetylxylan esterase [Pseudonocardiaceae bacterium]|jgi:cephalosporin-C deacetylase|nr:acetylxylan esterase [Pseudonocardiaceae bacterium]
MLTDLDRPALLAYRSDYRAPADFDEFWRKTLAETAGYDLDPRLAEVDTNLTTIDVHNLTFAGFGGHPVNAWLRVPRGHSGSLPGIVQFHGYGSGRGQAIEDLLFASAGYAHLLMDTRGQGGDHAGGDTGDPVGSGPSFPGFLTRGIAEKESYFYRRVFTDAVRAVEVLRGLDFVDEKRVAAVGNSQGGGIALAVAGLVPDLAAVHVQSPFLTDVRRALRITNSAPYKEIAGYLATRRYSVDAVFDVLSYFDGVGFASRAKAPAWFSTGLMDDICPPSTAFGAFHEYAGPKQIAVWDYNGHEAGGSADLTIVLREFAKLLHNKETAAQPGKSAPKR